MKMNFLTMNIYINAWLDCSNPFISIHNKYDDDLLAYFDTTETKQLIEGGEITVEDLHSTNPETQTQLIIDLIAIKSSESIKQQIGNISFQLKKRNPIFLISKKDTALKKNMDTKIINFFSPFTLKAV